jgi:hypothetical protein
MDNPRDKYPAQRVDLVASWPLYLPGGGFELVEGVQIPVPDIRHQSTFLVPRRAARGAEKTITIPEDLWEKFCSLTPETVLDFANRYGTLRAFGEHFHHPSDMRPLEGEPLENWLFEVTLFRAVLDLWDECQHGTSSKVSRVLESALKPKKIRWQAHEWTFRPLDSLPPEAGVDSPIEQAKRIVIYTINKELGPVQHYRLRCALTGCKYDSRWAEVDSTRVELRGGRGQTVPQLVIISENLIKTLWMQLASLVTGNRKLKKCEAPDCRQYIDVTKSGHPKARRMHDSCAERWRKRRYRDRRRQTKKGRKK